MKTIELSGLARQDGPAEAIKAAQAASPFAEAAKQKSGAQAVDYRVLAEFRHQLRIFLAFSETNARKEGLTSQPYLALLKGFGREKVMFVGELARPLLIKHHTAGELIVRMTELGLLKRNVDINDNGEVTLRIFPGNRCSVPKLFRMGSGTEWRILVSIR